MLMTRVQMARKTGTYIQRLTSITRSSLGPHDGRDRRVRLAECNGDQSVASRQEGQRGEGTKGTTGRTHGAKDWVGICLRLRRRPTEQGTGQGPKGPTPSLRQ